MSPKNYAPVGDGVDDSNSISDVAPSVHSETRYCWGKTATTAMIQSMPKRGRQKKRRSTIAKKSTEPRDDPRWVQRLRNRLQINNKCTDTQDSPLNSSTSKSSRDDAHMAPIPKEVFIIPFEGERFEL